MAETSVTARIDGQTYALAYHEATGKWEAECKAPEESSYGQEGHFYSVAVTASDGAGNSSTADASSDGTLGASLRLFVKETEPPNVVVLSPQAGAYLADPKPVVALQLRDTGSGVAVETFQLRLDEGDVLDSRAPGMSVTAVEGGYDVSYVPQSALKDGIHTVSAAVSDHDGNQAEAASRSFTTDTEPPVLAVAQPQDGFVAKQGSLVVSGTATDAASGPVTIRLTLNGSVQGTVTAGPYGAWSRTIPLRKGENTLLVTAEDRAGWTASAVLRGTFQEASLQIARVSISANPEDAGETHVICVEIAGGTAETVWGRAGQHDLTFEKAGPDIWRALVPAGGAGQAYEVRIWAENADGEQAYWEGTLSLQDGRPICALLVEDPYRVMLLPERQTAHLEKDRCEVQLTRRCSCAASV